MRSVVGDGLSTVPESLAVARRSNRYLIDQDIAVDGLSRGTCTRIQGFRAVGNALIASTSLLRVPLVWSTSGHHGYKL